MRITLLIVAVAVEIILFGLAHWQWRRMEEKQAQAAMPIMTLTLHGTWDNAHSAVLDNQPKPNVPANEVAPVGWRLLTPLVVVNAVAGQGAQPLAGKARHPTPLEGGRDPRGVNPHAIDQTEKVVIIDRGWLPLPPDRTQANLAPFAQSGTVTIRGQQAEFPQRKGWLGGPTLTTAPNILAFLDAAAITPSPTAPTYLQATATTPPQPAPILTQPPSLSRGVNHFAYALQWAFMALIFPFLCFAAWRRKTS